MCLQANAGSWLPLTRHDMPLASTEVQLPSWLWGGLHHFAPEAAAAAAHAVNALTASEYTDLDALRQVTSYVDVGWGG